MHNGGGQFCSNTVSTFNTLECKIEKPHRKKKCLIAVTILSCIRCNLLKNDCIKNKVYLPDISYENPLSSLVRRNVYCYDSRMRTVSLVLSPDAKPVLVEELRS